MYKKLFVWVNEHFNLLIIPRIFQFMSDEWKISKLVQDASTVDELKFIFSQAKDRVKETADEGDRLYNKSVAIIGICLTLITGLISFVVSSNSIILLKLITIFIIAILIIVAVVLKANLLPIGYRSIGSEPKQLLTDDFYSNLDDKCPMWYLLINEIRRYRERIDLNVQNNNIRNTRIKKAYYWLYSIPVITAVIACLWLIFQRYLHLYCQ